MGIKMPAQDMEPLSNMTSGKVLQEEPLFLLGISFQL